MLMIVSANPRQLTMVSAVPFISGETFCATSVENSGESAMTAVPQISKKLWNINLLSISKNIGETRQHKPEILRASIAIFFAPFAWARYPLKIQDKPPMPIIEKDQSDVFDMLSEWVSL